MHVFLNILNIQHALGYRQLKQRYGLYTMPLQTYNKNEIVDICSFMMDLHSRQWLVTGIKIFVRISHGPPRAHSVVIFLNIEQCCIISFLIHIFRLDTRSLI